MKMKMLTRILALVLIGVSARAAAEPAIVSEEFTFTSSFDGTGPLYATAVFQDNARNNPMMVVQHGYGGSRANVLFSAERIAARGYFCLCISTRGWEKSAGAHDDGGIEIMDIFDGIAAAEKRYGDKVDNTRISIIGYSNGGANVFFATVRFPYLFRAAAAFFGIADYGAWINQQQALREQVVKAVGGSPDELPDKYAARNATLAAGNLNGTRFHIFYDEEETLCPPTMNVAFAQAARRAGYRDLVVHVSKKTDKHRWHHGYNKGHLSPAEDIFLDDLEKRNPPKPIMPPTGELTVLGFLVTPGFTCIAGKGDDAAARLKYDLRNGTARFAFTPLTSDKNAPVRVTLQGVADCEVAVLVDGRKTAVIGKGARLQAKACISSTLEFREKK